MPDYFLTIRPKNLGQQVSSKLYLMKIAFAFTWLFNPNVGGTERVTDLLTKELKKRGHKIYYIYSVKRESDTNFSNPADKTLFIPETTLLSEKGTEIFKEYVKKHNIDFVINQGGVMGTCRTFTHVPNGCKSITVVHFEPRYGLDSLFMEQMKLRNGTIIEKLKRIYRFFNYPARRQKLKQYLKHLYSYWGTHSDKVVLLSNRFTAQFKSICPDFPSGKLAAIPNPLSFPINRECSLKENIILWVGRMDFKQKRPDLMVEIWKKAHTMIPGWKLIMLGDGPALVSVKSMATGLPRIEFPGIQRSFPFFQKAKILCSSSSSSEGWGMVLTEAASQGAIPIAFDSYASVRDIITTESQLVKPYDTREYAEKLATIAKDESLMNDLREEGYHSSERYTVESIADKWEELFKSVISETK